MLILSPMYSILAQSKVNRFAMAFDYGKSSLRGFPTNHSNALFGAKLSQWTLLGEL